MSTLTKILIVLLTISSVFLCGTVVTYVANADNYKQKYDTRKSSADSMREKVKGLTKQLNEKTDKHKLREEKLNNEITVVKTELVQLRGKLDGAERKKADLLQRLSSLAGVVETSSQTAEQQRQLFEETFDELNKVKAAQIKLNQKLNETTDALIEKMAIIETLETARKRLLEEKFELEEKLNKLLQPIGKIAVTEPITPEKATVRPARPAGRDIALHSTITNIDLKNSVAAVSIGTADGVTEGMKFYVTRGDEFICEILIIDVDAEKAVGILERMEQTPKIGDNVSTNL